MNSTVILIIVFIVAVLLGPFATLRAMAYWRDRRSKDAPPPARPKRDDDDDESW